MGDLGLAGDCFQQQLILLENLIEYRIIESVSSVVSIEINNKNLAFRSDQNLFHDWTRSATKKYISLTKHKYKKYNVAVRQNHSTC
jgi:hypothetical protein